METNEAPESHEEWLEKILREGIRSYIAKALERAEAVRILEAAGVPVILGYVCAECGGPLEEETEEDAAIRLKELRENFPGMTPEECGIVCEDCYQKIMKGIINNGNPSPLSS